MSAPLKKLRLTTAGCLVLLTTTGIHGQELDLGGPVRTAEAQEVGAGLTDESVEAEATELEATESETTESTDQQTTDLETSDRPRNGTRLT